MRVKHYSDVMVLTVVIVFASSESGSSGPVLLRQKEHDTDIEMLREGMANGHRLETISPSLLHSHRIVPLFSSTIIIFDLCCVNAGRIHQEC